MTDQLEQDLEALLARRAAATDAELAAQRAAIAGLPDRGRRAPRLAWAAVVLVAVGFAAAAIWRFEGTVAHAAGASVAGRRRQRATGDPGPVADPPPGRRRRGSARWWACSSASGRSRPSARPSAMRRSAARSWTTRTRRWPRSSTRDARVYTTIPLSGWARLDHSPRWTLYGSLNDGRRVALIVIEHTAAGWVPYQLAACDAADFTFPLQPGTKLPGWVDGNGQLDARDRRQRDRRLLRRDAAPPRRPPVRARPAGRRLRPHQTARHVRRRRVAAGRRRRHGLPPGQPAAFLAPDDHTVYVVSPLRVERWPRVKGDEYTRTDCN